jgi:hypothetical protein
MNIRHEYSGSIAGHDQRAELARRWEDRRKELASRERGRKGGVEYRVRVRVRVSVVIRV